MEHDFKVVEKDLGPVLEIEERASMFRMPVLFGRDFAKLIEYMKERGCECVGAPYSRYLEVDWCGEMKRGFFGSMLSALTKSWHFMVGMPSPRHLEGTSEIRSSTFGPRKYASATHRGSYRSVGKTYKALCCWMEAQGLHPENQAIEVYLNDPRTTAQKDLETSILVPLK